MTATAELVRFACPRMGEDVVQACAKIIEDVKRKRGEAVAALVARAIAEGWNEGGPL